MDIITQERKIYGIIYCITNLINKKMYVGQTIKSLECRWKQHLHSSKKPSTYIQNSIHKNGSDNFIIEQIDFAFSAEELNDKEEDWIYILNTFGKGGYNMTPGGENQFRRIVPIGKKVYSNTETNKIIYRFPDIDIPDGFVLGGKTLTEETKSKISESHKGLCFSENHKNNLSKSLKGREVWNKGITMADEQKKNMKGNKKIQTSEETKEKLSLISKEKIHIYNPLTNERRMIHYLEPIPDGFIRGRGKLEHKKERKKTNNNGRKWFHNDTLQKNIWVFPKDKPEDYNPGIKKY